jgi:putative transposase
LHGNGFDGAKSVNGRKRHLLVDTLGLVLSVLVTSADVPERKGLSLLLNRSKLHLPRLHYLWLDRGFKGVAFINLCFGVVLEIVARRVEKGFGLQASRWVVERTFAQVSIADAGRYALNLWLGNYRRLGRDYETLSASNEAFIYLASCDLITNLWC